MGWDDKGRSFGLESVRSHSGLWKGEKTPRIEVKIVGPEAQLPGFQHSVPFVTSEQFLYL